MHLWQGSYLHKTLPYILGVFQDISLFELKTKSLKQDSSQPQHKTLAWDELTMTVQ